METLTLSQKTSAQGTDRSLPTEPIANLHDRITDAYYGKMGQEFMRKTQERIHWVCASVQGNRILDVGCSQGIVPILLGREGKAVVGVDSDGQAVEQANAHLATEPTHVQAQVRFIQGNFLKQEFAGERFDTIVMSELLEHVISPQDFVAAAASLLTNDGHLVVTVPFGINDFIDHKRTYYLCDIYALLASHFDVGEVRVFGQWIGLVGKKMARPSCDPSAVTFTRDLLEKTEAGFHQIERELRTQWTTAKQKLDDANAKYRAATEQITDLQQKLSEEERLSQHAGAEAAKFEARLSNLSAEVRQQATVARAAEQDLIRVHAEADSLRSQLESATQKHQAAAEQILALKQNSAGEEAERRALAGQLAQLQQQFDNALAHQQAENATSGQELARLREQILARTGEKHAAEKDLIHTQAVAESLRSQLAAASQKYQAATKQISTLEQKTASEEAKRDALTKQLAQLQQQFDTTVANQRAEKAKSEPELTRLRDQIQSHADKKRTIELQRVRVETTLENVRSQLKTASQKYHSAAEQVATLKQKIAEEKQAYQTATALVTQLRIELQDTGANLKQEQTATATLRTHLESVTQNCQAATEHVSALRQQVTNERVAAEALRKQLNATAGNHQAAVEQLAAEQARSKKAADTLRQETAAALAKAQALDAKLQDANRKYSAATEQYDAIKAETASTAALLAKAQSEHAQELESIKQRSQQETKKELAKLERELNRALIARTVAEAQIARTRETLSFQLGYLLLHGFKSWEAFKRFPGQLLALRQEAKRRKQGKKQKTSSVTTPSVRVPVSTKLQPVAASNSKVTASLPPPVRVQAPANAEPKETPKASAPSPVRMPISEKNLKSLRLAGIFDEFTYHSFAPDCQLLQLRSDSWKQQITEFKPDLLFIESAWRGANDSWYKKISDISLELLELIDWAEKNNVATAFWSKEDPVHFTRFLPVAKLVDHVFTTDIDCIPRYMAALQHDRVHLLPFAAQPALHNPVETLPREDAFCFAGSYYSKYPKRQADFHELVTVGRKLRSVVIYDRNSKRPQPNDFSYPDEYRVELREALDYTEMDRAYKGFRFGITVNTIQQSQTMFARRAFELMACNTIVVSNFSRGLRLFFGDLAIASSNARELEQQLQPICASEIRYRALRLLGLRNVLSQHTYAHRLAYVVSHVSGEQIKIPSTRVCIIAEPITADQTRRVVDAALAQNWNDTSLLLVGKISTPVPEHPRIRWVELRTEIAGALNDFDYVAVFHPDDHYGPNYLTDLALATRYFKGDGLTKAAFYRADGTGTAVLHAESAQYHPTVSACLRRSLITTEVFKQTLGNSASQLAASKLASGSFLSIDEFSYCEHAHTGPIAFNSAAVEAISPGRSPADYKATIQHIAEAIKVPSTGINDSEPFFVLTPNELAKQLPKKVDPSIKITHPGQEHIMLDSTLSADQFKYLYLGRRFRPDELASTASSEMRLKLEIDTTSEATLNLNTVLLFRDASEQKISHLIQKAGVPNTFKVPANTDHVRIGLRLQGLGQATIRQLCVTPVAPNPIQSISSADHLVVARNYPAYDDLYRYAFVHARIRAYKYAGERAEIFRLTSNCDANFREFEGIDITEADAVTLDQYLTKNTYRNVLVHIVDPNIWEIVSRHLDHVRVTIWAHGSEIQQWWRRVFGNPDASNESARNYNADRKTMWQEILRLRHPNLTVVFISRQQLREVLADLCIRPAELGQVEVIHNFIDTERFRYQPKPVELRKRVLSIRPYASHVYGNDLAIQAILRLSSEPFFSDLHFRLVGDGKLFDATVAPVRDFPNVEITKGFLTQGQIAALHREYGVFLVPSRMDSQGVSRDEAMASGLVPVTNRVAAIPEFVDADCGFLAEPEDVEGLAQAIATLYKDPLRFQKMSQAAASRVRNQSDYSRTIAHELRLLKEGPKESVAAQLVQEEATQRHIVIYGDVNMNILDGSAIWAASLAETLAGGQDVRVIVLLKAHIKRTFVLSRLLDMTPAVQLVEPSVRENETLSPAQAVAEISALVAHYPVHAVVLRGFQVCEEATREESLRGKIWAYLTDIPQRADEMNDSSRERISRIINHSAYVLCQTPQIESYLHKLFPTSVGRTRMLPPMIPPMSGLRQKFSSIDKPFRIAYAGKFAPRWGIRELFSAQRDLYAVDPTSELHVFGDKVHNPADDPEFSTTVKARLQSGRGLIWHGAVNRDELMKWLPSMHVCWAFRDPAFERETLELSTKVLEYAALGVPMILARSKVLEEVLGVNYPLFATSASEANFLLLRLTREPSLREVAAANLEIAVSQFTFSAVRDRLHVQRLI